MTRLLGQILLVVTPLSLAVVLWWHPPGGDEIYEDARDDVEAWMFVHAVFLFVPLTAAAVYLLLRGLESRAATAQGWPCQQLECPATYWSPWAGCPRTSPCLSSSRSSMR